MKLRLITILILILAFGCGETSKELVEKETNIQQKSEKVENIELSQNDSTDFSKYKVHGLPCPNSSTHAGGPWTYEEAESHKNEIYDMAVTSKHKNWENPTSGGAIHINANDQVEVYQFTFGIYQGMIGDTAVSFAHAPKDTSVIVPINEMRHNVQGVGFGNESSVLITSEILPKDSQVFSDVIEELFRPGMQLYYLKNLK